MTCANIWQLFAVFVLSGFFGFVVGWAVGVAGTFKRPPPLDGEQFIEQGPDHD